MKKISSIFFLAVYLFATTELHQLAKLPVIFHHFAEHKLEDKNITFLKFLSIHYLHGTPKDKDYERDMQLPFKTCDDSISCISPAFIPVVIEPLIASPLEINHQKILIKKVHFTISSYLSNIWQPPKSC